MQLTIVIFMCVAWKVLIAKTDLATLGHQWTLRQRWLHFLLQMGTQQDLLRRRKLSVFLVYQDWPIEMPLG